MPGPDSTRYFFDTEFIEDGSTIELISIGIAANDGREFYAEVRDEDIPWERADQWVLDNVRPHLSSGPKYAKSELGAAILAFVKAGLGKPIFVAYYGDYDWVVLCRLFGRMIDLPKGWPMFAMDLKQMAVERGDPRLPTQDSSEHHALADARWNRDIFEFLDALPTDASATLDLS